VKNGSKLMKAPGETTQWPSYGFCVQLFWF
jgi:hypothetical protein